MSIILDWIFEGMAQWIASVMTGIMDAISNIFLNALGTDMVAMEEYFPFITKAYDIMQYTAWAILLLVTVWQLFRVFGGPITEAENPLHLITRSSIFALLIAYAKPIFGIALDIARGPYSALMDTTMDPGDFTFAGIQNVLESGMVALGASVSVVGLLLIIILMIALGWNYFKLLLEVIERYVLVGVMCYTSPLAYSLGGSKATNKVFQSWCRMVGSQMLMLIMNVWFLRAFNSSVGHFMANGGALSGGGGNIFLWLFCAVAFLKIAQKFDSYLASLGLNVAQTGGSLGIEMLMAARALGGSAGGGMKSAGAIFRGGATAGAAGSTGGASGSFMSGFASKFKPNSFVRDAVVEGGSKVGAGGSIGLVGRTFGGMAARNGAALSGDSIATVAARAPSVSGSIAGDIANRSIGNYMPHLEGKPLDETKISGGRISTVATAANGKQAAVEMYNATQFEAPNAPHSIVTASDGSQWYQTASGPGMGEFYAGPSFTGDPSESGLVTEAFPSLDEGTTLRSVDEGMIEATHPETGASMMYNSAFFDEPAAPHETIQDANGVSWYATFPDAETPFETKDTIAPAPKSGGTIVGGIDAPVSAGLSNPTVGPGDVISGGKSSLVSPDVAEGAPEAPAIAGPISSGIPASGPVSSAPISAGTDTASIGTPADASTIGPAISGTSDTAISGAGAADRSMLTAEYNRLQFQSFMPGFTEKVAQINPERSSNGIFEVKHPDGSGTQFYDKNQYQSPKGDYQVFEDKNGGQWYAIQGKAAVERRPVYKDGKPVYEKDQLKTVNVETIKYSTTLTKFDGPAKRDVNSTIKPPNKKQ